VESRTLIHQPTGNPLICRGFPKSGEFPALIHQGNPLICRGFPQSVGIWTSYTPRQPADLPRVSEKWRITGSYTPRQPRSGPAVARCDPLDAAAGTPHKWISGCTCGRVTHGIVGSPVTPE
jgi:hypothetical protein